MPGEREACSHRRIMLESLSGTAVAGGSVAVPPTIEGRSTLVRVWLPLDPELADGSNPYKRAREETQ